MTKQISKTFFFSSDSDPDRTYQTLLYDNGETSCDCRGWVFKRGGTRSCRHTRFVEAGLGERHAIRVIGSSKPSTVVQVRGAGFATSDTGVGRKFNWRAGE